MDVWKYEIISRVDQDISLVRFAHLWDILVNTPHIHVLFSIYSYDDTGSTMVPTVWYWFNHGTYDDTGLTMVPMITLVYRWYLWWHWFTHGTYDGTVYHSTYNDNGMTMVLIDDNDLSMVKY